MVRTPFVAANWKMHKTIADAVVFIENFQPLVSDIEDVDIVLCPPFTALPALHDKRNRGGLYLGAQDMHWEANGAFTGEISPLMLTGLCEFVIIGHSERRAYFDETDEVVNKKLAAAFEHGLRPILCVGESLEQREAGKTEAFVSAQIENALGGFSAKQLATMVIAYEPIWAIGTGKAASPESAADAINETIRKKLSELYEDPVAGAMRILYGGSVKPGNAASFFDVEGIDGALVGGAGLEAESFAAIVQAAL